MNSYSKNNTRNFVFVSLFVALIILQTSVPFLGFISIGPISMTIIPITVILASLWLDLKSAVIVGLTFGLCSFLRTWLIGNPVERLIFTNPLISVLPRVMMPIVVHYCKKLLMKAGSRAQMVGLVGGLVGSLINTVFVLGAMYLFGGSNILSAYDVTNHSELLLVLGGIVTANGIPEAILATIITPLILKPLTRIKPLAY
ncbi:ECF transporter S component [Hutsoniella sourekii]|uniref:ECF transporter S component n=1 Tax=Hutsoniella sourekii TaxID=87650 RepID=UPI000482DF4E|nr:ECF transporter S component [Hutsoniella sourekii]